MKKAGMIAVAFLCAVLMGTSAFAQEPVPDYRSMMIRAAAEGDTEAREKLIDGNLRLVLSLVGRFSGRGENPDDLFQVGCIGLIKAVDCFDLSQNVQFSTYGVPAINGWRKDEKRFSP